MFQPKDSAHVAGVHLVLLWEGTSTGNVQSKKGRWRQSPKDAGAESGLTLHPKSSEKNSTPEKEDVDGMAPIFHDPVPKTRQVMNSCELHFRVSYVVLLVHLSKPDFITRPGDWHVAKCSSQVQETLWSRSLSLSESNHP